MRLAQVLSITAGSAALVFALCASKCEQSTEIIPYVKEICADTVDNDADGLVDCRDSDCDFECTVSVAINQIPTLTKDSLTVTGTHFNATGITLSVLPSGTAGTPVITGNTWTAQITQLADRTTYTVTAIASDAQSRRDTATATFDRTN
jgi:hypothetical protein